VVRQTSAITQTFKTFLLAGIAVSAFPGVVLAAEDTVASDEPVVLEPIVITARKVKEKLRDAPLAVTAKTRDTLDIEKTDTLADVAKTAPNVMAFNANGMSFIIRGVGSQSMQGLNTETGVGLFADEVYLGRPDAAPVYLDDLERVEVVRGAQASLYGRNTIGGAVNLVAREPGEVLSTEVKASVGNDGSRRLRGAIDVPVGDSGWFTRTFLSFNRQPDGIDNLSTGQSDLNQDAISGRVTVLGDVGDNTSLKFTLDGERVKDDSMGGWAPVALAFNHQSNLDFPGEQTDVRGGGTVRLDHDFDRMYIRSITAYRKFTEDMILDGDFGSGPYNPGGGVFALQQGRDQNQWQFTQEFRLTSDTFSDPQPGDIGWNAGLFYMYENFDGYEFFELASVDRSQVSRNALDGTSKTYAVFGGFNYRITDALSLQGGGRITREDKSGTVEILSPSGTNFYGTPQSGKASLSTTNISPEIGVSYALDDNALLYGRISRGFKSGGIAQFFNADGSVNVYDPETSLNFEAGVKTSFLNDKVSMELNVFHTDWKDMQSNVFISDFQRVTANAASATSKGAEVALAAAVTDELRIGASYGFLQSKFDDFVYTYFSAGAGSNVTVDFSGNDVPIAPKHSASLTLDWDRKLDNGMALSASGIYSYRSSYAFDSVGTYRQAPTHLVDASLGLGYGNWQAKLWVKNLLDEEYLSNYFLFTGADYGIAAKGRSFGVSLSHKW